MKIQVKLQQDHLEEIASGQNPLNAVAELLWNSLDADATDVRVSFDRTTLSDVTGITVADNGHGIDPKDAETAFGSLGGSWKKDTFTSPGGRVLHGKAGKGRFRAFSLGDNVSWSTTFQGGKGGQARAFTINGTRTDLGTFDVSEPQPANARTPGTIVEIQKLRNKLGPLFHPGAAVEVAKRFALYLSIYTDSRVTYDGSPVDPSVIQAARFEVELPPVDIDSGKTVKATLTIIEWKVQVDRALFLCDNDGFTLGELQAGIQAPGFNFTAYLKSDALRTLVSDGAITFLEAHPGLQKLLAPAKEQMRSYFRKRASEEGTKKVDDWQREGVYPYNGKPRDIGEATERQVFDVLALNVSAYLPSFEQTEVKQKKLSLRLIKQALEQSPRELTRILSDVLDLPKEKRTELADLLERTTLAAIISASKVVADRLNFLYGLEVLVFDTKEELLERDQLHKILADHTWIFGEQFNLTSNEESLNKVLRKHLTLLGREPTSDEPVLLPNGKPGRLDLMLSRLVPQPKADEREHLVVELKRPKQPINGEVAAQIKNYAFTVAEDDRFRDTNTRWVFWAISNMVTPDVRREARQRGRPEGLLFEDEKDRITVWVKSWSQIIEDCRARLNFFQKSLAYTADRESALALLRKTHERYIPESLKKKP